MMNAISPSSLAGPASELSSAMAASPAREMRLRKHADYQRVYRTTRKQFSSSMTWFLSPRDGEARGDGSVPVGAVSAGPLSATRSHVASVPVAGPRVGLTAGKVLGKAHERNRIKRRMREAVRRHIGELPGGVDLVLHPKRSVLTIEFVKLEAEVLRIFRQAAAQVRVQRQSSAAVQAQS